MQEAFCPCGDRRLRYRQIPEMCRSDCGRPCRTHSPRGAKEPGSDTDWVLPDHRRQRIHLFADGVISFSGHTTVKISATAMPIDTSTNR
jgi:hypothetical protein